MKGSLETAVYSNSVDTDTFLDKNKPTYIGGILEMMNNRLYRFWGDLEEGLLTGLPQNEAKEGQNFFGVIYQDPKKLREFVNAMRWDTNGQLHGFCSTFDFSKYKPLADIGGSAGLLSLMVAKHQAHMSCTTVDLPAVVPIATETIQKFQLTDRVKAVIGDFFTDAFPMQI